MFEGQQVDSFYLQDVPLVHSLHQSVKTWIYVVKQFDSEEDRDNSKLNQRWRGLLENCLDSKVTICNVRRVKECFSFMAIGNDKLFHKLNHTVAHLSCDVKDAVHVAQVISHILLALVHFIVHILRIKWSKLVLSWVDYWPWQKGG